MQPQHGPSLPIMPIHFRISKETVLSGEKSSDECVAVPMSALQVRDPPPGHACWATPRSCFTHPWRAIRETPTRPLMFELGLRCEASAPGMYVHDLYILYPLCPLNAADSFLPSRAHRTNGYRRGVLLLFFNVSAFRTVFISNG